jgi:ATP-binding cassette subfamily C protein
LVRERPRRLAWVVGVQVAAGLAQAVGVLLLVALLAAVGVGGRNGVAHWIRGIFGDLGLKPTLTTVLAVYVVIVAASAALGAYQTVLATRYRLEFVDHLRGRLYAAVAHARWPYLMGVRQSDVLAVLTTNVMWVGVGALGALNVVVALIVICAQLAAAIRISPALTGLAVVSGLLLMAVVWPLVRRSQRLGSELVQRNRGVLALATGFLDALKLAKLYGREEEHVRTFNDAVTDSRGSQIEFARASAIASAVQAVLAAVLLAVTVEVAVDDVHASVSSLLVVALVFTRVVSQITSSQTSIQQVAQSLPAFEEVMALVSSSEEAREAGPVLGDGSVRSGIGDGIRLAEVHFSYPLREGDRQEALRGVSLEIPAGSLIALTGPSGAGKTTLADLLAGLIVPSSGEVIVAGRPLRSDRLLEWRGSVALVPQDPFLFHDTVEANLRWASPGADEQQLWEALSMAAATEVVERLPLGLKSVVGDRGMLLSGGERQRLALARALLRDPELLILDEATSALDSGNELTIRTALTGLRGRTTVLVIAHRLSTARDADQIVVLDAGRVVEAGSWSELSRMPLGRLNALIANGPVASTEAGEGRESLATRLTD